MTEEQQDVRVDAGYNGWWSCLIPAEIVAAIGLPLPLFFQWDDIEYGFRARSQGFATVTLPGAGVWHADFGWKDWDDWHRYFNIRNAMVTAALHSDFPRRPRSPAADGPAGPVPRVPCSTAWRTRWSSAVEDFNRGPGMLQDGGVGRPPRSGRSVRPTGRRSGTPPRPSPACARGTPAYADSAPEPSMKRAVLAKRMAYQLLGRTRPATVTIPASGAHWYHVSRFETAVVTDASQEGVRLRRRDVATARDLLVRGGRALAQLSREASGLQEQYRSAVPQLTSRENWARLFGRP